MLITSLTSQIFRHNRDTLITTWHALFSSSQLLFLRWIVCRGIPLQPQTPRINNKDSVFYGFYFEQIHRGIAWKFLVCQTKSVLDSFQRKSLERRNLITKRALSVTEGKIMNAFLQGRLPFVVWHQKATSERDNQNMSCNWSWIVWIKLSRVSLTEISSHFNTSFTCTKYVK